MEPPQPAAPPLSAAVPATTTAPHNYPDSVDSSPRSRNADSLDEPLFPSAAGGGGGKLRLMCSYGGHIVPRPHDKSLCYVGGDTRIVVADRHASLADLSNRLSKTLLNGQSFTFKYQLPSEDLDSLISVTTDEDLENMVEEYDRLAATAAAANKKSSRIRLFLFPVKPDSASSIGSLLENSAQSEDWFLNALNGATGRFSESPSVNSLLGVNDDVAATGDPSAKDVEAQLESFGNVKGKLGAGQDVHSVPDSPILETTSSFGSTSSSPSLANLPPIRVHPDDHKLAPAVAGIEEQFSQMGVGPAMQTTFAAAPATVATQGLGLVSAGIPVEFSNRVFSDDERSDQGMPIGYRKQPQVPQQPPPKPTVGLDLASPDSVSSDSSTNPLSRQRPMVYQDPIVQNPSMNNTRGGPNPIDPKLSDPNTRVSMQQIQDSGYVLTAQFDQQNQQLNPQQLNPQQQQHFIQAGTHYIHQHPTGAVPMQSYYHPMYPPQQQPLHPLNQPYPVYYMSAKQAQAYNLPPVQQQSYGEAATVTATPSSQPQAPPPSGMMPPPAAYNTIRNAPASKPEMQAGMYRTATAVQVPSGQHQQQYVGFSQIHHPSQSIAPTSVAVGNYGYEFAEAGHGQIYYTQPLAPQMAPQYQTMASGPAMVLPEASAQLPTDTAKQQIKTSQP